jgi:hypothetical protein
MDSERLKTKLINDSGIAIVVKMRNHGEFHNFPPKKGLVGNGQPFIFDHSDENTEYYIEATGTSTGVGKDTFTYLDSVHWRKITLLMDANTNPPEVYWYGTKGRKGSDVAGLPRAARRPAASGALVLPVPPTPTCCLIM